MPEKMRMKQFTTQYSLLAVAVAGFLVTGKAYATQSPPTPGPSVGHRPVLTNLTLGTGKGAGNGVITDPAASFGMGDTIRLLSAVGTDADGDPDKAGAYCVWYKVPAGGGTPVLVKDPGPADRDCKYTIQPGDIGFHIQNSIKIYSDPDLAAAKKYTINPVDSIATETLSATAVTTPYIKGLKTKKRTDFSSSTSWTHSESDRFPSTGYAGAEFQMLIDNGAGTLINNLYKWQSSSTAEMSVDANGNITLIKPPSGELSVTATPGFGGAEFNYRFRIRDWFVSYGGNAPFTQANSWATGQCITQLGGTGPATQAQLTPAKNIGDYPDKPSMGSLFGEWGSAGPSLFTGSDFFFWLNQNVLVSLISGDLMRAHSQNAGNAMCHIRL